MLLIIDNYDSFVHNLDRYCAELGAETTVVRNDRITVDGIRELGPSGILLSPGPCTPRTAGVCIDAVRMLWREVPILGVCLGHQAVASAFGGRIVRAPVPVHGHTATIRHDGTGLFAGLPERLYR